MPPSTHENCFLLKIVPNYREFTVLPCLCLQMEWYPSNECFKAGAWCYSLGQQNICIWWFGWKWYVIIYFFVNLWYILSFWRNPFMCSVLSPADLWKNCKIFGKSAKFCTNILKFAIKSSWNIVLLFNKKWPLLLCMAQVWNKLCKFSKNVVHRGMSFTSSITLNSIPFKDPPEFILYLYIYFNFISLFW